MKRLDTAKMKLESLDKYHSINSKQDHVLPDAETCYGSPVGFIRVVTQYVSPVGRPSYVKTFFILGKDGRDRRISQAKLAQALYDAYAQEEIDERDGGQWEEDAAQVEAPADEKEIPVVTGNSAVDEAKADLALLVKLAREKADRSEYGLVGSAFAHLIIGHVTCGLTVVQSRTSLSKRDHYRQDWRLDGKRIAKSKLEHQLALAYSDRNLGDALVADGIIEPKADTKPELADLEELDYIEIIDMDAADLMAYSREDLVRFIHFQADVLHEAEKDN